MRRRRSCAVGAEEEACWCVPVMGVVDRTTRASGRGTGARAGEIAGFLPGGAPVAAPPGGPPAAPFLSGSASRWAGAAGGGGAGTTSPAQQGRQVVGVVALVAGEERHQVAEGH